MKTFLFSAPLILLIFILFSGCESDQEGFSLCRKSAEAARVLREEGKTAIADALLQAADPCAGMVESKIDPGRSYDPRSWMMTIGDSLKGRGNRALAGQLYREADIFYTRKEDWANAYLARIKTASSLSYPDSLAEALGFPLFDETIGQIKARYGDTSALLPEAYHAKALAFINHYFDKDVQAIHLLHQERGLLERFHPEKWDERLTVYVNLGLVYSYRAMLDSSIFYLNQFSEALPHKKALSPITENNGWQTLARVYTDYGDLDNVEAPLQLVINHYLRSGNALLLGFAYNDMAILKKNLKQAEEGLKYAQLAIAQLSGEEGRETDLANCFHTMGQIYMQMDSLEKAEVHFEKALSLFGKDSMKRALTYNEMSVALKRGGKYGAGRDTLEKAIAINLEAGERLKLVGNYDNLGDILYREGDLDGALQAYQQSIRYHLPGFEAKTIYDNPDLGKALVAIPRDLLNPLSSKAKTLYQVYLKAPRERKLLEASVETYRLVDSLLDQIRDGYTADKSKESLAATAKPILEGAIHANLALYKLTGDERDLERAFAFSEKGKAMVLLDAIRFSKAKDLGLSEVESLEEKRLSLRLGYLQRQLITGAPGGSPELIKELAELKVRRQALLDRFGAEPKYRKYLDAKSGASLSLRQIREELLGEEQVLIEYFWGEEQLFLFTVTSDHAYVDIVPADQWFSGKIDQMREGIYGCRSDAAGCDGVEMDRLDRLYAESAFDLYQLLIAPLEKYNLSEGLLIIPDGKLGYLPFEALLSKPQEQTGAFQTYAYLLDRYRISYAFSASLLREMKTLRGGAGRDEVLAFAPSFDGSVIPETGAFLADLRQNETTAQHARNVFGGAVYKGRKAEKGRFISEASQYRYLVLATHGVTFDDQPDKSFVAFTQRGDTVDVEELLLLSEIYPLELNADLVVLSACNTSLGKLVDGEGIISLARSFSYAGAKCLVTTLWSVGDEASSRLLSAFFDKLSKDMAKDEALTLAKRQLRGMSAFNYQYAYPYYWAGYVMIGDTETKGLVQ